MDIIAAFIAGAICATAIPSVHLWAGKARDYLFGLLRKGPDDSDKAGA